MKEYFFLKGKEQFGPYTIDELSSKGLTNESLVWTEGMDKWLKLKELPELVQVLKPKSIPPPIPIDESERVSKTEVSGQLKVTAQKEPNPIIESIKPSRKVLIFYIIWCTFHLFALLMSYSEIKGFNYKNYNCDNAPRTDRFWPFVSYGESYRTYKEKQVPYFDDSEMAKILGRQYTYRTIQEYDGEKFRFFGIFSEYDWSEFAFYVLGSFVIYFLIKISKKK